MASSPHGISSIPRHVTHFTAEQVFRQSLGDVGKLVPPAASRDPSSFGRAEPSGATAPDAEPWLAEGKGEAADLVNLVPGACSGMELGEYYAKLTSLLAPEALLVEWQVSDARGVGLIRDISERFHACKGAVWVRLTLWGFDYTHVDVAVGGTPTPVSGGVKYDTIKRGHYVMIRLPAESLEDDGLAGNQVTLRELRCSTTALQRPHVSPHDVPCILRQRHNAQHRAWVLATHILGCSVP